MWEYVNLIGGNQALPVLKTTVSQWLLTIITEFVTAEKLLDN